MKPVDSLEFWKERIKTAQMEHFSVYVTTPDKWDNINQAHQAIFKEMIEPGKKVLDAGCGYGRWASWFNPESYVGVDFSPDFIAKAKEQNPDCRFLVANLKELPFGQYEFDWAFCVSIKRMVIDNLGEAEWERMLKELKRVAKQVLILEYEDPKPFEVL